MKERPEILRPEQLEAVYKMKNGCILNGGVGSGKSRTSLYYWYYCTDRRELYIITTAAKRDKKEWIDEGIPFGFKADGSNVVIDSWNNIKKYAKVYGAFFIFDEDRITGKGEWVKTFLKIARRNKWIVLSATPGDSWDQYIPIFVANGFYKNRTEFMEEHAVYCPYCTFPKIDRWVGVNKLVRLRNSILIPINIERFTVRHEEWIDCAFDRNVYKKVMKDRWDIYKNEPIAQASSLCYVLRRICNEDESRQVKLLELLEKTEKCIVFYNFDYELEILKSLGYVKGTKVAEWNGHNHEPIPKTKRWVYLVQYTAGCEGWNCVETNTIVFFSQNYSYKVLEQARGRIDRMNTRYKDLYYYHFISHSNIDMAIRNTLNCKKKFNEGKFATRYFGG